MSGRCRAYFVGGPKHGDIDYIADMLDQVLVPIATSAASRLVDHGHYWSRADVDDRAGYRRGTYRRGHRLAGGEFDGHRDDRSFLYIYAGEC